MPEGNVVDDTVGSIFSKLGLTGTAAAIVTIVFGIIVLLEVVEISLIIGLYLIIVGVIQFVGNVPALTAKK